MDSVQKLLSHFEKHEIQVQVPEDGKTVKLKVRPNDNIKCIRVHLVKQGVTSWKMVFMYKGQQLGENEKLEVKRIGNGSVLMLVRKGLRFGDQLRKGGQRRRGGNRGFLKWERLVQGHQRPLELHRGADDPDAGRPDSGIIRSSLKLQQSSNCPDCPAPRDVLLS